MSFDIHSGVKILPRHVVPQLWPTGRTLDSFAIKNSKFVNRLVVRYKYTSRCENLYCVAIVAHRWLRRISYILRIQNSYIYILYY